MMWEAIGDQIYKVAQFLTDTGWAVFITRDPHSEEPQVYLSILPPEGGNFKIDTNRPPFVFVDDKIVLDAGESLGYTLILLNLGKSDPGHYECFDDHAKILVWHGQGDVKDSPFLASLFTGSELKIEVFVQPHGIETLVINLSDVECVVREALKP